MALPNFWLLMLPILKALADGREVPLAEIRARVADALGLKSEDLQERVRSDSQPVFDNRVSWSMTCLTHAGLVKTVRRAVYQILPEGVDLLNQDPPCIDRDVLRKYPKYLEWDSEVRRRPRVVKTGQQPPHDENGDEETPDEKLDRILAERRAILESKILDRIRASIPRCLEQVVVDLLIAMGYGGGDTDMGRVTGGAGDGGIDGTVREDKLGLDEIYVQAKKYAEGNTVGEGDLRNFAGAIDAAGTTKGVFVTTSDFTKGAREFVKLCPKRISLIDGKELAHLMVQYGVGVRKWESQEIKNMALSIKGIKEDYFTDLDS